MQEQNEFTPENSNQSITQSMHQMSFTDILDGMFTIYRKHFPMLMGISVVYLILEFARIHLSAYISIGGGIQDNLIVMIYSGIISLFIYILVSGALIYACALCYLERTITIKDAYQQTVKRFFPFLGSSLLWFLAIVCMSITIVGIPFSIYFGVRWGLYSIPVLFEETTATKGFTRSSQLVTGSWWRVLGIMLAIFLITFMIAFIFQTIFLMLFSSITGIEEEPDETFWEHIESIITPKPLQIGWLAFSIQQFVTLSISSILMPIGLIGSTLLYFDLRIRKEAYDLEMQVTE